MTFLRHKIKIAGKKAKIAQKKKYLTKEERWQIAEGVKTFSSGENNFRGETKSIKEILNG